MTARDFLAAVQQRADAATRNREMYGSGSRSRRITQEESATDVPRLVAALTAVLDLHRADSDGDCIACGVDAYEEAIPWPCETVRVITAALTPKENDS